MSEWTIFCPGPSLKNMQDVEYHWKCSIAVNGAILKGFTVAYWAMLDYQVFMSCIKHLDLKAVTEVTTIWVPENWLPHIHQWMPGLTSTFKLFRCETFPGQDLRGMMPFAQAYNWHLYSVFSAMALAVLKRAKVIKIYGADMQGEGYFRNGLENERTGHSDKRWEGERKLYELISQECKKHGVEVLRL